LLHRRYALNVNAKVLDEDALQPNTHSTEGVFWALIAQINGCLVEYVKWGPGTRFPRHENLEPAYIFIISSELINGEASFPAKTAVKYPAGYIHNDYSSETGAEFILVWPGRESVKYLDD
jgi:hypothetical protein